MRNVFHLSAWLLIPLGAGCAHTMVDERPQMPSSADAPRATHADNPEDAPGGLVNAPATPSTVESPSADSKYAWEPQQITPDARAGKNDRSVVLNAEGDGSISAAVEPLMEKMAREVQTNTPGARFSMTISGRPSGDIGPGVGLTPTVARARAPAVDSGTPKYAGGVDIDVEVSPGEGTAGTPSRSASAQHVKPLRGQIFGLTNDGLVLTDALGQVLRPRPGEAEFRFRSGEAYFPDRKSHQLMVVRQPVGQTCQIENVKERADSAIIRCFRASGKPSLSIKPMMRDCFLVATSGATFTLGYQLNGRWQRYADVAMDPVGIDRQQHRTYVGGRLLLEAIVHLPLVAPVAKIEWLNFSGDAKVGGALQRTGRSGGMPLDLKVGESRSFTVTESVQEASRAQARVTAEEQRIKLVAIGALDTQAGRFPLACHLEETSHFLERPVHSWYAPGYGVVKTEIQLPDGSVRNLEAIEIQQQPR